MKQCLLISTIHLLTKLVFKYILNQLFKEIDMKILIPNLLMSLGNLLHIIVLECLFSFISKGH